MSTIADRTYLKDHQYKSPGNLEARINLHRRFQVNTYPWQRWVFDQLEITEGMRILEVGCGTAELWRMNLDRIPYDIYPILGDLSIGMAHQAKIKLSRGGFFSYLCLDAQNIPTPSCSFDVVIANHMLYHVPDIRGALGEIWNILKPGGRLAAATNGIGHMIELHDLIKKYKFNFNPDNVGIARFSLESAPEVAGSVFPHVETHKYIDHLEVTEVEPLIDYIKSMIDMIGLSDPTVLENLTDYVSSLIKTNNSFHISKSQGLVIGIKEQ